MKSVTIENRGREVRKYLTIVWKNEIRAVKNEKPHSVIKNEALKLGGTRLGLVTSCL